MELKDLLNFLNIEDVTDETDFDEFKKKFNERFALASSIEEEKGKLGERMGIAEKEIKKLFKSQGVEFEEGETKDKSLEEIVKIGSEKLTESHQSKIKELKDAAGKTDDKKLKELEAKLEKQQSQWDQDREQLDKVKSELDEKQQNWEQEKTTWKINEQVKSAKSKIPVIDKISEIQKRGFDSLISDKAKFELDEEGSVWPVDPKTGKKFENPDKTGEYLNLESFLKNQAIEAGIYKQNGGGSPSDTKITHQQENGQQRNDDRYKHVHPSLRPDA